MNLISLKARNFLRLEAAEISPDGAVVEITGANGSGKSSLLTALVCALAGKDAVPADPVRHGADEATIEVDLDELRIRLVIYPNRDTKLVVTNAEGFKATSPQKLLDGLYSKLIDPVEFSRMKAKDQRALVAELAGLSAMLDELARADDADRAARRDVNRDLKQAEARLAAAPEVAAVEPVDVSATLAEIRAAREHNAAVVREHQRRDGELQAAAGYRAKAQTCRDEAQRLLDQAAKLDATATEMEEVIAGMANGPDPIDLDELEARLEDAEAINAQHRQYLDRQQLAEEVAGLTYQSNAYTHALTAREAERRAVIEAADLPIAGLGFGDDCLTYDGVRLDQASTAESIRVCTAIAMAMSPKIRVLLVRDWSLLDSKTRTLMVEMAEARGYLILAELVDESGEVGVYIEDGRVAAINGVPVEPASEVPV